MKLLQNIPSATIRFVMKKYASADKSQPHPIVLGSKDLFDAISSTISQKNDVFP